MKPSSNIKNMKNPNKGTSGVNKQYQDVLNNKSIQIANTKKEKKNG